MTTSICAQVALKMFSIIYSTKYTTQMLHYKFAASKAQHKFAALSMQNKQNKMITKMVQMVIRVALQDADSHYNIFPASW